MLKTGCKRCTPGPLLLKIYLGDIHTICFNSGLIQSVPNIYCTWYVVLVLYFRYTKVTWTTHNTDNAWMETVAVNFHDENWDTAARAELKAGDDAVGVQWMDLGTEIKLYASHKQFLEAVAKLRGSHW